MKFYDCVVFADFFYGVLDNDNLAVDVVTEFFKGFSNLDVVYRAEYCACRACLGADSEADALELFSNGFCVGFEFGELVGALALVFGEYLQGAFACDDCFALGG